MNKLMLFFVVVCFCVGCQTVDPNPVPEPDKIISGSGTVVYVDLEGGFYGIVADNGAQYRPANLLPRFQVKNMRINFRGKYVQDSMNIQMWGRNLQLVDITSLDDGENGNLVTGYATVQYIELEGGFYGLIADDGKQYVPTNLDKKYRQEGIRIYFQGQPEEQQMGIQMWGNRLKLTKVKMQYDE